jgi:hypothetical protein
MKSIHALVFLHTVLGSIAKAKSKKRMMMMMTMMVVVVVVGSDR